MLHRGLARRAAGLDRAHRCRVGAFLAGIALLGPFVLTRFDLYRRHRDARGDLRDSPRRRYLGPVLLGVAIATKIYPAVLLPLLVTRIWRREGRARGAARAWR